MISLTSAKSVAASLEEISIWGNNLVTLRLINDNQFDSLKNAIKKAQLGQLDRPHESLLTILLLGGTGVGKSAILNALAGSKIAISDHKRPTTTHPTIYTHQMVDSQQLFEYGTALGDLGKIEFSLITHNRDELRNKVIIDSPDVDGHAKEHRERVLQLLPIVDVVLFVVTPDKYIDAAAWNILMEQRGQRAFAFILNKLDNLKELEKEKVKLHFTSYLHTSGYKNPRLFCISAQYWYEKKIGQKDRHQPPEGDQFIEFQQWLSSGLSTNEIVLIEKQRRRALWGNLAAEISAIQAVLPMIANWNEQTKAKIQDLDEEIWALIKTHISTHLHLLPYTFGITKYPRSFGILGLYLSTINRLQTLPRFSTVINSFFSKIENTNDASFPYKLVVANFMPDIERHLNEWKRNAAQKGLPYQQLFEEWQSNLENLPAKFSATIYDSINQGFGRFRYRIGSALINLFDLALTLILMIAFFRMFAAYLSANYLQSDFVINTIAIFCLTILVAHLIARFLFPPIQNKIAMEIEHSLSLWWRSFINELSTKFDDFMNTSQILKEKGVEFSTWVDNQVQSLQMLHLDDSHIKDLFIEE